MENIDSLRQEIDSLDDQIIELIQMRTSISRRIGQLRDGMGGPRIVPERETQIRRRYAAVGSEGDEIASALLRLGRGPDEDATS